MTNKNLSIALVVVGIIAIIGVFVPKSQIVFAPIERTGQAYGTAGDTFGSAKFAGQSITTASTTFAYLFNGDSRDRIVDYVVLNAQTSNVGTTTTYEVKTATSTTQYKLGTANTLIDSVLPGQNSATITYVSTASTTLSTAGSAPRLWAANTYIVFYIASTSAGGANETILDTLASTTSGVAGVYYHTAY